MNSLPILCFFFALTLYHFPLKKLIILKKFSQDILFFIINNTILIIAILIFAFYYQDSFLTYLLNTFLLINTLFYLKEISSYNQNFIYYIIPYLLINILFIPYLFYLNIL